MGLGVAFHGRVFACGLVFCRSHGAIFSARGFCLLPLNFSQFAAQTLPLARMFMFLLCKSHELGGSTQIRTEDPRLVEAML